MKTLVTSLAVLLMGSVAMASSDIVCKSNANGSETTVVISDKTSLTMTIYRSFHGHTNPPQSVAVTQLRGSRGAVLVYGDAPEHKLLTINLNSRNQKNEARGTFSDKTVGDIPLDVSCAL